MSEPAPWMTTPLTAEELAARAPKPVIKHTFPVRWDLAQDHPAYPHGSIGYSRGCRCHRCRKANAKSNARYRGRLMERTPEQIVVDRERLRPDGLKVCRICRMPLPFEEFRANRTRSDGLQEFCTMCDMEMKASWEAMQQLGWKTMPGKAHELACAYRCGRVATTLDHYIPLAHGGTNELDNFVPACADCNRLKKDLHPSDFMDMRGIKRITWPKGLRSR